MSQRRVEAVGPRQLPVEVCEAKSRRAREIYWVIGWLYDGATEVKDGFKDG